jgi:hypothetical protein
MIHFDEKTDVIGIELTSYGKYLLSKGKFKPSYYAFFDDEIIYDFRYSELSESQNEIQQRILNETPQFRPQVYFSSPEHKITAPLDVINNNITALKEQESQNTSEKQYALSSPLGKSSYNSEYYPAWNVFLSEGKVTTIQTHIDNSDNSTNVLMPFYKMPQINISESVYQVVITKNELYEEPQFSELADPFEDNGDFYYYSYKEDNILVDISELNVNDEKLNFDIEVFIEEEKKLSGIINPINSWRQLQFAKETVHIKNGILLDEPENLKAALLDVDSTFAAHYIKILVDQEIELTPKQMAKLGIYMPIDGSIPKPPY